MTDISKFLSDVNKIMKHDRQNNSGKSDYERIHDDIRKLFERMSSVPGQLPDSIFNYWENEYIFNSMNQTAEPSEDNLNHLAAFLAFLGNSDELDSYIVDKDWEELADAVKYEAEDLPIDILQDLMSILVSHGAY